MQVVAPSPLKSSPPVCFGVLFFCFSVVAKLVVDCLRPEMVIAADGALRCQGRDPFQSR